MVGIQQQSFTVHKQKEYLGAVNVDLNGMFSQAHERQGNSLAVLVAQNLDMTHPSLDISI